MTSTRECAIFVCGLSAGISIALFFTPRASAEMKTQVKGKVNEGIRVLREGKAAMGRAVEREVHGVNAAIDAGKRAYQVATS